MQQNYNYQRQTSNEITHVLLHNVDDVNSAIFLIKLQNKKLSETILNFLKTKFGNKDFEFYNTYSQIIEIERINRVDVSYRKIYFQEKKNQMKNKEEISKLIDVFTQKYDKKNKQEGQIIELQQLKQEKQQIEYQNQELENQISLIRSQSQDDEQQIRELYQEISNLMEKMNNQEQLNQKYEEECHNLKNENSALQNLLREAKFNQSTQIDLQNKERDNKFHPKIRFNTRPILESKQSKQAKQDQFFIQSSQIFKSNCIIQNEQQSNYINKCGHYLDISQIQQQICFAIKNNTIAQCNSCQASLQSKLCLLIQDYGRNYLEIKNQIELSQIQQNLQIKIKYNEKLVKCSNDNCEFFCIWQQNNQNRIQGQFGRFPQQKNGYCPQCLQFYVISPEIQTPIYQTQINCYQRKVY